METATLLNIKSTAHQSTDIITGQALAMVSSDKNKTDGFKSAFKSQMDNKKNDDIRAEKKLPHNGNELPKKKIAVNKNDDDHKLKDSDDQIKNVKHDRSEHENSDHENNVKQMNDDSVKDSEQTNSHEQTNAQEQAGSDEQTNAQGQAGSDEQTNAQEQTNSHEQINIQEQENSSESVKNYGQTLFNDFRATETADSQQLENAINSELSEQQTTLEQQSQQQSESNAELSDVSLLNSEQAKPAISPDSLYRDKKIQAEAVRGQFNISRPASSDNLISQMAANTASGSGSEGKNESALTKSIAEFQQFIEMSKKHSVAGESIASVKAFEQSMKNEQTTAQLLLNNIKLPAAQLAGQTSQPAQVIMQPISLDRVNSSLSFSQTVSSLEVKTPVGKAGWNQNFSNQIIMMANNGVQQAKIKLNPRSLGPVEAMVKLSGETAVVNLTSLHLSTKDALESALPRLKEMLNENGFSQVDVNVSHQDKKEQQEAALGNKQDSNNEHGNSTMPGDEQLSDETLESESDVQTADSEVELNIVDYYA